MAIIQSITPISMTIHRVLVEVRRVAITQLVKQCSKQYNLFKTQRCKIVEVKRVAIPCWAVAKPKRPLVTRLLGRYAVSTVEDVYKMW